MSSHENQIRGKQPSEQRRPKQVLATVPAHNVLVRHAARDARAAAHANQRQRRDGRDSVDARAGRQPAVRPRVDHQRPSRLFGAIAGTKNNGTLDYGHEDKTMTQKGSSFPRHVCEKCKAEKLKNSEKTIQNSNHTNMIKTFQIFAFYRITMSLLNG